MKVPRCFRPLCLAGVLLLGAGFPLQGHIADEIAVKTGIFFNREDVSFSFDIYSGILFSTAFLKILDPDKNKTFEEAHIRDFSDFFLESLELEIGGAPLRPEFKSFSASEWDFFAAGISTVTLEYRLPLLAEAPEQSSEESGEAQVSALRYDFSFYPNSAVYSLNIKNNVPDALAILGESRNEFLQDEVELRYTREPRLVAAHLAETAPKEMPGVLPGKMPGDPVPSPLGSAARVRAGFGEFVRNSFENWGIIDFIRGGPGSTGALAFLGPSKKTALFLVLILALAVGFLHAFTPGHGKALVGAFLIANQGTALHAFFLGLVITLTHTASIYGFGLLASVAARFFLPGELIPLLTVGCGFFIMGLGLWSFVRRVLGTEPDHAHLLPNLRVLGRDTVNILIDGQAAEANEALLIAQDDESLQMSLKAAGAEDFNFCSPGCSAHTRLPRAIQERQHAEFFKMAVKTGAVDAVVARSDRTIRYMGKLRDKTWVQPSAAAMERPRELLFRAIRNFSYRGAIVMPRERLSWGRVISLGISGGIVPCPDALAVLLVAAAAGRVALGMGIIFIFSLGLALALILVGMIIVFTKGLLVRQKKLGFAARYVPYISSLVITFLGLLMIRSSLKF
ncbi:MAG: sulfite exporter TauE/SafE family protein [Treponema sp.]|jgi:ABC-type nickel/cobalt efflux system permease component RcnA|nr:sulfite exporter TauE/SafE family protein [Treponema sp.]